MTKFEECLARLNELRLQKDIAKEDMYFDAYNIASALARGITPLSEQIEQFAEHKKKYLELQDAELDEHQRLLDEAKNNERRNKKS